MTKFRIWTSIRKSFLKVVHSSIKCKALKDSLIAVVKLLFWWSDIRKGLVVVPSWNRMVCQQHGSFGKVTMILFTFQKNIYPLGFLKASCESSAKKSKRKENIHSHISDHGRPYKVGLQDARAHYKRRN